jgi:hypothetical protein
MMGKVQKPSNFKYSFVFRTVSFILKALSLARNECF